MNNQVTIRCPRCGFSREIPASKVPDDAVRATCPQCRQAFSLQDTSPHPSTASSPDLSPLQPAEALALPRPSRPAQKAPKSPRKLSPVADLFDRTWTIYKRRAVTLILIYLAMLGLILVPIAILVGIGLLVGQTSAATLAVLTLVAVVTVPLAGAWGGAAITCAVADERIGIGEAFARSRRLLLSFIWVFTLAGFLIAGGFLLFIIPGILFSVWFFFAQYIVAAEESRGMSAMLKSREYVRGYGWQVFLRLFLVSIIGGVIGVIPVLGPLLSFFFTPFFMLWTFLVYEDLRAIKGDPAFGCGTREKARWLVRGAAGYVVFPLLLLAVYGPMFYHMVRGITAGDLSALMSPRLMVSGNPPEPSFSLKDTIRPADFPLLSGDWRGAELGGADAWQFSFQGSDHTVTVQAPDGAWLQGSAVIRFDIGERDGSIRVPPGWGVLDVEVAASSNGAQVGEVALGTFSVHGDELKLCVGEPGSTVRAEEFASAPGIRCFQLARAAGTAGTSVYQYPTEAGESPSSPPAADLSDVGVFVYAVNYTGVIRVNGREFKALEGERDMQYNYNEFGKDFFQVGENTLELEYTPLPGLPADHWLLKIRIEVSRGNTVIGSWEITERHPGSQKFVLDIPQ